MIDPAKEKSAPEPKPQRDSGPQDPTKGGDKKGA